MPRVRAGDADEKQHARWIGDNKRKEKGTNSAYLKCTDRLWGTLMAQHEIDHMFLLYTAHDQIFHLATI